MPGKTNSNVPRKTRTGGPSFCAKRTAGEWALVWVIIAYLVVMFSLALRQYSVFGRDGSLYAENNSMFWWTLHGKWFYVPPYEISMFAQHAPLFHILLLPFYWIAPGVSTLLFLQTLALALAAIPVYLLARKLLACESAAVLLAIAFLLFPPLISQNLNQIQQPSFLPVVLMFAIYFFVENCLGWFLAFAFLSCTVRENVPVAICMFGVWALIERRGWKWAVAPMALGAVYFVLATKVIMPTFRSAGNMQIYGQQWHVLRYFSYLGQTPSQILATIPSHPGILVEHVLQRDVLTYLVLLTQPLGWVLPFGGWAALIAVPDLLGNMLTSETMMRVIPYHYNVVTGTALFAGAIFGVRRLAGILQRRLSGGNYAPVLAGTLVALCAAHWMLWLDLGRFEKLPYHDTLVKALEFVPKDASLLVPRRMLGQASSRPKWDVNAVFWKEYLGAEPRSIPTDWGSTFEYVILDANERQYPPFITRDIFMQFYTNTTYQLVFNENNVFVFHHVQSPMPTTVAPQNNR